MLRDELLLMMLLAGRRDLPLSELGAKLDAIDHSASVSALHQTLAKLCFYDVVEAGDMPCYKGNGRPAKRTYRITPSGERQLKTWRSIRAKLCPELDLFAK